MSLTSNTFKIDDNYYYSNIQPQYLTLYYYGAIRSTTYK